MDRYEAIAIVYEIARAHSGLLEVNGMGLDGQEEAAMNEVRKILQEMEKDSGSQHIG